MRWTMGSLSEIPNTYGASPFPKSLLFLQLNHATNTTGNCACEADLEYDTRELECLEPSVAPTTKWGLIIFWICIFIALVIAVWCILKLVEKNPFYILGEFLLKETDTHHPM